METKNLKDSVVNLIRCLWYSNETRNTLLVVAVLSVFVPVLLLMTNCVVDSMQTTDYLSVLSSLSGFCFAGMAIIMSMPNDSLKKLNTGIEKKEHCECMRPFDCKGLSNKTCLDDLFATMAIGVIVPLLGIVGSLVRPFFSIHPCISSVLKMTIIIFSILWSIHIVIHFFMLRSTLLGNNKQ